MNKCTIEKRFLFCKWKKKNHDFSYNSSRKIGAIRKCKRCGAKEILRDIERVDETIFEIWDDYIKL